MTHEITRVYRCELVIVFHVDADMDADGDNTECERLREKVAEHFDERYRGRVRDDDVYIDCAGNGLNAIATLQLRLPTMKGEFKSRQRAEAFVAEKGWTDATLVIRNSPEDYALRAYSITMLPQGQD